MLSEGFRRPISTKMPSPPESLLTQTGRSYDGSIAGRYLAILNKHD